MIEEFDPIYDHPDDEPDGFSYIDRAAKTQLMRVSRVAALRSILDWVHQRMPRSYYGDDGETRAAFTLIRGRLSEAQLDAQRMAATMGMIASDDVKKEVVAETLEWLTRERVACMGFFDPDGEEPGRYWSEAKERFQAEIRLKLNEGFGLPFLSEEEDDD